MENMVYDERDEAKLTLSQAVLQVMRRHKELGAYIYEGHRRIVKREGRRDPFISSAELEVALSRAFARPESVKDNGPRITMINALLEVSYKVPSQLKRLIIDQARDNALAADQNHEKAEQNAQLVLSWGSNGMEHFREQQAKDSARLTMDREKRERLQLEGLRKRAKYEAGV